MVFKFQNIKPGASVVVNVKGNQAVEFHNGWRFWWNGTEIGNGYYHEASDEEKKGYEQASQAILWNFQNTPKLTIRGGMLRDGQALRWANIDDKGTSGGVKDVPVTVDDDPAAAMIGSILVPRGSFEDHVTTNGRVWVGKDFMMYNPTMAADFPSGIGDGPSSSVIDMDQERHNFPWKGSMRSECSTISWTKVDESGNTLPGSTWGVYKDKIDAVIEKNALYPAVKDNDIPSGDWNPDEGKFRVDSLAPDATYYIKELTAPQGYVKSDNIYAIHTTNTEQLDAFHGFGVVGDLLRPTVCTRLGQRPDRAGQTLVRWIPATTVDTNASGDRLEAHVTLTVKSVELNSLTLQYNGQAAPARISTTVGNTITLTATADPGVLNNSITWESSDSSVATVDNGVVTPLKAGTTTIWAKCKDDHSKFLRRHSI